MKLTPAQALNKRCPVCDAAPGAGCTYVARMRAHRSRAGAPIKHLHIERRHRSADALLDTDELKQLRRWLAEYGDVLTGAAS